MIQRWVASALVEAEPRFRRVRSYRDLRYLVGGPGRAGSRRPAQSLTWRRNRRLRRGNREFVTREVQTTNGTIPRRARRPLVDAAPVSGPRTSNVASESVDGRATGSINRRRGVGQLASAEYACRTPRPAP